MDYYSVTKECNYVILSNANGTCMEKLHAFPCTYKIFWEVQCKDSGYQHLAREEWRRVHREDGIVYKYSYVRGIVTFNRLGTL